MHFPLVVDDGCLLAGMWVDPSGSGPVVVYVHGFRSQRDGAKASALGAWAHQAGHAFLSFDLRGHGQSGGAPGDLFISRLVADLVFVVDRLAPRPVVLVGSSLGGWLAWEAAKARPAGVAALVLVAPAFDFISHYFGGLDPAILATWATDGVRWVSDPFLPAPYPVAFTVFADAKRHRVEGSAPRAGQAVALVHGGRDEAVPCAQSEAFYRALWAPAKRLWLVADGDHRLHNGLDALVEALAWALAQAFKPGP